MRPVSSAQSSSSWIRRASSTRSWYQSLMSSSRCSSQDCVTGMSAPSLAPRWAWAWLRSSVATTFSRSDTVASWDFIPLFHLLRNESASGPSHVTVCTDDVIDSSLDDSRAAVLSNVVANRSTSTSSAPSCAM